MDFQIILGLILTVLPITELRGGLPVVIEYCVKNRLPVLPYFLVVLILNILVIFFIFIFLDKVHERLMSFSSYKKGFGKVISRVHRKSEKVKESQYPYLVLLLFVAVPLPGTGAWTGTLVAWLLGLDRKRSFIFTSLGVIIAGLIILLLSLGFLSWIN